MEEGDLKAAEEIKKSGADIVFVGLGSPKQEDFIIKDYQGHIDKIVQHKGACIVPATYELNKSIEYADFLDENSEERSIFIE